MSLKETAKQVLSVVQFEVTARVRRCIRQGGICHYAQRENTS